MHNPSHIHARNRKRGQSMVEFALAFPIFLLIVIGIMEFGRLFITYTSVYAAAREGARYGAAVDNLCDDNIEAEAERAGFLAGDMNVEVTYEVFDKNLNLVSVLDAESCNPASFHAGDRIVVTTSMPFKFITGLIPVPGGGPITLQSTAKRTIIQKVSLSWTLVPAATNQTGITPAVTTGITPGVTETLDPGTTPTPELPKCNTTSITGYTSDTSPYTVTLVNTGSEIYLESISVYWEQNNSDLVQITMTGDDYLWQGFEEESPATIDLSEDPWVVFNGTQYLTITFGGLPKAKFKGVTLVMSDPLTGAKCTIP